MCRDIGDDVSSDRRQRSRRLPPVVASPVARSAPERRRAHCGYVRISTRYRCIMESCLISSVLGPRPACSRSSRVRPAKSSIRANSLGGSTGVLGPFSWPLRSYSGRGSSRVGGSVLCECGTWIPRTPCIWPFATFMREPSVSSRSFARSLSARQAFATRSCSVHMRVATTMSEATSTFSSSVSNAVTLCWTSFSRWKQRWAAKSIQSCGASAKF